MIRTIVFVLSTVLCVIVAQEIAASPLWIAPIAIGLFLGGIFLGEIVIPLVWHYLKRWFERADEERY